MPGNSMKIVLTGGKMKLLSYDCQGPKSDIVDVSIDIKNPSMVYAKLSNGGIVVFHTKYKEAVETTSFNPIPFFNKRTKKDITVCKIFKSIDPKGSDNIPQEHGSLSVTKNHMLTVEKFVLKLFEVVIASKPLVGSYPLLEMALEITDPESSRSFKLPSFNLGGQKACSSTFDKGFSSVAIDSSTGVQPRAKQSGFMSFLSAAKAPTDVEPVFLVGFNTLVPSSDTSDAKSFIRIYNFNTPEKDKNSSSGSVSLSYQNITKSYTSIIQRSYFPSRL